MIPKIIHYCWFGHGPLPKLAQECIASWKKFLPEYEIKEWNESNFDVNAIPYTQKAYELKKYAFVSDYARFWILYKYGGVYFDTDVEVIKPMDDILEKGAFMGCEYDGLKGAKEIAVAPGLGLACEANDPLIQKIINFYKTQEYDWENNPKTIVHLTTEVLKEQGLKEITGFQNIGNFTIYPSDYFAPINGITKRLHITKNTRTIHRYMASWSEKSKKENIKQKIRKLLPESLLLFINHIKNPNDQLKV